MEKEERQKEKGKGKVGYRRAGELAVDLSWLFTRVMEKMLTRKQRRKSRRKTRTEGQRNRGNANDNVVYI